jgi:hypothetical protein
MDAAEGPPPRRREAVLASLRLAAPAELEGRFRRFLDAHGGSVNDWDQRFLDFIARHRAGPLLAGHAGGGFEFVFCPADSSGFWVLDARDGASGKGFLTAHDAERLLSLAREKGLVH